MKSLTFFLVLITLYGPGFLLAQNTEPYRVTHTGAGHPDFEGNWHVRFVTTLERPEGIETLVVPLEQARAIAARINSFIPHNEDPDFEWQGVSNLAEVRGEYRTSIIVDPEDGRLPYRESAMELVAFNAERYQTQFDHPEQRPLSERCLSTFGGPPIHAIPLMFPYKIVQTTDHLLLYGEGPVGLRLVNLNSVRNRNEIPLSHKGYSTGIWEGDSLIVTTTNIREDHPSRTGFGRPLLVGPETTITERFTRVSENELNYFFTVDDDTYYSQPFSGEFSLFAHKGPLYEYGCHEGNYSLPGILRGGQLQASETP